MPGSNQASSPKVASLKSTGPLKVASLKVASSPKVAPTKKVDPVKVASLKSAFPLKVTPEKPRPYPMRVAPRRLYPANSTRRMLLVLGNDVDEPPQLIRA